MEVTEDTHASGSEVIEPSVIRDTDVKSVPCNSALDMQLTRACCLIYIR